MKIGISPQLIKSVATIYTSIYRVFMEFIDNSLDAAQEFYNIETQSYNKEINIAIKFSGNGLEDFKVEISDNCKGIHDLSRIVSSIGNSNKRDLPLVNGQFGFGMCSFIAFCNKMTITTRTIESVQNRAVITGDIFENEEIEDTEVVMTSELTQLRMNFGIRINQIGTSVCLEEFYKDKYKQININELINEIEKHFEILLQRKGLEISVTFPNGQSHVCMPFDYNKFKGEIYFNKITTLKYTSNKKTQKKGQIDINNHPVIIFLKLINNKTIDRRPFFVINGRRISEISDVKAFRSISKSMIWSHPNITGYIDVSGNLEPTIARNEFKENRISKALFSTLLDEEQKIKSFVEDSLKISHGAKFKKLEIILENTLNEVASELSDASRKKRKSENDLRYLTNAETNSYQTFAIENRNRSNGKVFDLLSQSNVIRTDPVKGSKKRYTKIQVPSMKLSDSIEKIDSGLGFNIRIDSVNDPLKDENEQLIRSIMRGNEIVIYQKHPECLSRINNTRNGIPIVTTNLINYLCVEILKNFKELELQKGGDSINVKKILKDFTDSLYSFEKKLRVIDGKKLSEFK